MEKETKMKEWKAFRREARAEDAAAKGEKSVGFFESFRLSAGELRHLITIVVCGMMGALSIVLGTLTSISIGPYIKVGFSGIPNRIVDMLYGPVTGGIFSAVMDIVKFMVKPDGDFFPGYSLTAALASVIYGVAFYRHKITLPRMFVAQALVKIICNVFLNTLWLNLLYGKAFFALLPSRLIRNAIMLPVDTILYYIVLKAVGKAAKAVLEHPDVHTARKLEAGAKAGSGEKGPDA